VQPTDSRSQVGFCVFSTKTAQEGHERDTRIQPKGLVAGPGDRLMMAKHMATRVLLALSSLAAIALAGGASIRL
jgi:hypothetical protein